MRRGIAIISENKPIQLTFYVFLVSLLCGCPGGGGGGGGGDSVGDTEETGQSETSTRLPGSHVSVVPEEPDSSVDIPEINYFDVKKKGSTVILKWNLSVSGGEREILCGDTPFVFDEGVLEKNQNPDPDDDSFEGYPVDLTDPAQPGEYGIFDVYMAVTVDGERVESEKKEIDVGVLRWDRVPQADGYILYPMEDNGNSSFPEITPESALRYDINSNFVTEVRLIDLYEYGLLESGKSYQFAVKSYSENPDEDDTDLTTSDWSNSVSCGRYHVEKVGK